MSSGQKGTILRWLGLEKQSQYVRDYFYTYNIRSSIYMSAVVIVLEIWMIIRLTRTLIVNDLMGNFSHYFQKYYLYYILLLCSGIAMMTYALIFQRGQRRRKNKGEPLLVTTKQKVIGNSILYFFSFICIYFGIRVSLNDYAKGEQMLTFLTMELFVVCPLTWRPIEGFLILSVSYGYYYYRIDQMAPINNPEVIGTTLATQINFFTMWLSTLLVCFSNYSKTRAQALQDESLVKINAHLSEISVKDELTGIHNMLYFRSEAEKLMSYVTTDRTRVVYLFLDIENFKSYNEQYGFHKGNELLVKFAQSLEQAFRGSVVARYSDDHFVVLTANEGVEQTVKALSEEIRVYQGEVRLSLKCGAYLPAGDEADPSLACDRARFACNSIKKHYDRSFRYYDKSLEDQFQLKQYIVNNIDTAIANGYIKVYYQPVIDTTNGCICGLEALARWQDPDYGLLPPGAFIGILEEYRQIYKLDRCIVEQVCRDYRESVDSGEPFVPVSLNFSRLDFEMCDMIAHLNEQAEKFGVPREFLDVEITESALSDRADLLVTTIQNLRTTGYHVWLDDFGSGYSSLNVLKDYQFDVLKIDMKFLTGFGTNGKTTTIINNIITLTQQLDMLSLTEGVETQEQYDFLRSIGCNRAQGYLFSKPVPLDTLRARIHAKELTVSPEFAHTGGTATT